MSDEKAKVSCFEVTVLVTNALIGAGILSMPAQVARHAGEDALWSLLLGIIIGLGGAAIVTALGRLFPKESFAQYMPKLFGAYLGFLLNCLFTAYLLVAAAAALRLFGESVNVLMLRRTPLEVTMASMLVVGSMIARNGLAPIARACQIVFFVLFIPLITLPLFVDQFDISAFQPVLYNGLRPVVMGALASLFSLAGFELILVFMPNVKGNSNMLRATLGAVIIASAFYVFVITTTIGVLTAPQVAKLRDPIVEVIKYVPVPVIALERLDLAFLTIWIAAAYTTLILIIYSASYHFAHTLQWKSGRHLVWPICIVIFVLARIPPNQDVLQQYVEAFSYIWLGLVYGFVPFTLCLALIRRKLTAKPKKK